MTLSARFFPLLPALCLAACSGTGGEEASTALPSASPDPVASNKVKSGDWFDDDGDKIRDKYGSYNPKMTKDGQVVEEAGKEFDGFKRDNPEFKGRWDKKEYNGGEKKKSFWGDKDYVKKVYEGDTDANSLKKDSRFNRSKANEGSMAARDSGKSYDTDAYATGRAREERNDKISKTSDAETDERRKVFTDPDIIPWQAQNGMSVQDTNRMMGR